MAAGSKYISRLDNPLAPNQFYNYLEPVINEFFVQGNNADLDKLDDLYCIKRASTASPRALEALKSRSAPDIAKFAEPNGALPALFGVSELDLVDFLLRYENNRVLCIVGTVGVGKTTFLRHIFFRMAEKCTSLKRFIPVMIDCLKVCSKRLNHGDLLYAAMSAIRDVCEGREYVAQLRMPLDLLSERYDFVTNSARTSATEGSFQAFFREFQGICGSAFQPVLILTIWISVHPL